MLASLLNRKVLINYRSRKFPFDSTFSNQLNEEFPQEKLLRHLPVKYANLARARSIKENYGTTVLAREYLKQDLIQKKINDSIAALGFETSLNISKVSMGKGNLIVQYFLAGHKKTLNDTGLREISKLTRHKLRNSGFECIRRVYLKEDRLLEFNGPE